MAKTIRLHNFLIIIIAVGGGGGGGGILKWSKSNFFGSVSRFQSPTVWALLSGFLFLFFKPFTAMMSLQNDQ